jgi:hypothetical protein
VLATLAGLETTKLNSGTTEIILPPRFGTDKEYFTVLNDTFIDAKQLAALLHVSLQSLQVHRCAGTGIPYVKIGKTVRYRLSDIEAYLTRQRRASDTRR